MPAEQSKGAAPTGDTSPQQPVEIILLRQWASYVSVPVWIAAPDGALIFYNEAAEAVLGRRFDEAGEMPSETLSSIFRTRAHDGEPLDASELPLNIALSERRPAHRAVHIHGLDGVGREIEITAFPVEGHGGRHVGACAIFWEIEKP